MTRRAWLVAASVAVFATTQSTRITGGVREISVARGDTWTTIGARHGVSPQVLARRNGRTLRDVLKAGDPLVVDNRHIAVRVGDAAIVVNVPQRMLFHWVGGELRASYPIAVGRRGWETPTGEFQVLSLETDPTWEVPPSIQDEMRRENKPVVTVVPPGPANPLGRHWLGLSMPGIGIHGTNAPTSIFQAATHGCIRLHPDDIEELDGHVVPGASGRIIYEPVLATVVERTVWLEVHPDVYRRVRDVNALARDAIERAGGASLADPELVREAVRARDGLAVNVTLARARGTSRSPRSLQPAA